MNKGLYSIGTDGNAYRQILRKAREEVQKALDNYELVGEHEYDISEHLQIALAEIDKAIGDETGKRD